MYDGGKMDGADLTGAIPRRGTVPSQRTPNRAIQIRQSHPMCSPYFAMAEQYTFGDRMFQTNEGPSFPAHQFITRRYFGPDCHEPAV